MSCLIRLTAAVVRYFSGIHSFYAGLLPLIVFFVVFVVFCFFVFFCFMFLLCIAQSFGEDVVDDSVIQSAVSYLLNQQKRSGKFDLIGRSHNNRLVVHENYYFLNF